MVGFRQLLYGPVYSLLGSPATLTIGPNSYSLTVRDRTAGVQLMGPIEIETVKPVAAVLRGDLDDLGISLDQLDGARLVLNTKTWKVLSHRSMPTPAGPSDGQVYMILEGTGA